MAPKRINSWEWSTYDARPRWRAPALASPSLVIVVRDAENDARFGVGIWDRAIFAKVIGALQRAGANVVGLDFHFGEESLVERGGAASDRELINTAASSCNVIFPFPVSFGDQSGTISSQTMPLKNGLSRVILSMDPAIGRMIITAILGFGLTLGLVVQVAQAEAFDVKRDCSISETKEMNFGMAFKAAHFFFNTGPEFSISLKACVA